jgi:hypothetical protein
VQNAIDPSDRVTKLIATLYNRTHSELNENALVLLLQVLRDGNQGQTSAGHLAGLAAEWRSVLVTEQAGQAIDDGPMLHVHPQSAAGHAPLKSTEVPRRLVACAAAVGYIRVRRAVDTLIPTATGWLIAPSLLLTCWHVVEAQLQKEPALSAANLQQQIVNALCTFDYTIPGKGVSYGVERLEHYAAAPHLDYAVLRLKERQSYPLSARGFLTLAEADAPLTQATEVCVIQHPQDNQQLLSYGIFDRQPDIFQIFHTAASDQGTSGAPVLNTHDWTVVGMHKGRVDQSTLFIATRSRAIMNELRENCPTIHKEIDKAQAARRQRAHQ